MKVNTYYLDPFGSMIPMQEQFPFDLPQQITKEPTMGTAVSSLSVSNAPTQESLAFERIVHRAKEEYNEKDRALRKQYGITKDDTPRTPKDLIERIKAGKYVLRDEYENSYCYNPGEYITWKDPKIEKDQDGYEKASKKLEKSYQETLDLIYISTGEEGLKAFQKFEKEKI